MPTPKPPLDILSDIKQFLDLGVVDIQTDEDWLDKWVQWSIMKEKLQEAAHASTQDR